MIRRNKNSGLSAVMPPDPTHIHLKLPCSVSVVCTLCHRNLRTIFTFSKGKLGYYWGNIYIFSFSLRGCSKILVIQKEEGKAYADQTDKAKGWGGGVGQMLTLTDKGGCGKC